MNTFYSLHYRGNASVTDWYIKTVEGVVRDRICMEILPVWNEIEKKGKAEDWYFVSDILSFAKLYFRGKRNIVLWIQGIVPEESYSKHHSRCKYAVLSLIEQFAIRHARVLLLVSSAMKEFYERKYRMKINEDRCFIMPCFNDELDEDSFAEHEYKRNEFIYAGGLSIWQCFEETLDLYKEIEDRYTNVSLRVLTADQKMAEEKIKARQINNYSVGYVNGTQMKEELRRAKFGFCIREDTAINNVATPTKLSSYICNGVIPIYTSAIKDFYRQAGQDPYCLNRDDKDFWEKLTLLLDTDLKWRDIYDCYKRDFGNYYSRKAYGGV